MKESAGKFADSRFEWILQQFNLASPGEFLFPQGNDKIHIYLNLTHEERIAAAYWGTVIFSFPGQDGDLFGGI